MPHIASLCYNHRYYCCFMQTSLAFYLGQMFQNMKTFLDAEARLAATSPRIKV